MSALPLLLTIAGYAFIALGLYGLGSLLARFLRIG